MSSADRNRPLDLSWEEPLPHALTPTRTYLSTPSASTQVAIVAIHGRGDSARDFADAFVPHLRAFFGSHLQGEMDDNENMSGAETSPESGGARVTLRALEAQDGIWFGTHTPKGDSDLAFQAPYVHSSLLKLTHEIQSLNRIGVPNSRIVLVGFSQGAILINSYLLRALQLLSQDAAQVRVQNGELEGAEWRAVRVEAATASVLFRLGRDDLVLRDDVPNSGMAVLLQRVRIFHF
ncbi:hypothetical protein PSEUBRA_006293 [Kalmanozyma brasiliensis GHG001]|uniref:uncharacterized protein n=1 Tax=Kalmanozyma brasiliensis (strain GHG001) TaxID=1365824 RepID=UPI0028681175|nr:uncharacterized protein PSEUBRA_006293 [Kalmanozyma brasiliensis GHG001]KAF6767656.1 hypothetical protein PSEUBRA_006293 [Kalmanozyma brasiliensis GHG001]